MTKCAYLAIGIFLVLGSVQTIVDEDFKWDLKTRQQFDALNHHLRVTKDLKQAKIWLQKLFENGRDIIRKGFSAIRLPPLDPFKIGSLHISKDLIKGLGNYIDISGDLSNVVLTGLSDFTFINGDVTLIPPRLYSNFEIPALRLSGENTLSGKIANWIPLNAKGPFFLAVKGINISIDAPLNFTDENQIFLGDLKLEFNVKQFECDLLSSGFMGSMVNSVLSGTLKTVFDKFVPPRFEELSSLLKNLINKILMAMYEKYHGK